MDEGSSLQFDKEEVKKKITIIFTHRKRATVKSKESKKSTKRTAPPVAEPLQQFMIEGFGSRPHSLALPPIEEVLGTPSVSRTLFTSPIPVSGESALVVSAPFAILQSLLWRIKRLPYMRKISVKFKDYAHSIVQNSYMQCDLDKYFLKGFKE
ncbi:hypothetical protein AAC387_Pa04g1145 [Persea americana]